ncbi:MAG: acyltransferase [Deltaproteobacteria bacterium]|nr:acyltransferase [Deltaproteobacteria bacterium]MBW1847839.1 acyltransferase [Deltaproteobacteria bacterium]MBW1983128.1 acyltransferase [Deltaproteobacteria bacterium]MBW2179168.1 acyltransferase [Deltaproteobacteria bacterium]
MRREHRPYYIKKFFTDIQKFYVKHFLEPQLKSLGEEPSFIKPWHIEVFGSPIEIGNYVNIIASPDSRVRLTVWPTNPDRKDEGRISIGSYCVICPGVRLSSAMEITIGDSCMMANRVYITDSDWHDIYNRASTGNPKPVRIEENAWLGDSVIVCKGVTVGKNSIIGAGAVVASDIPANVIAAGNPAKVIKELDPNEQVTPRSQWYSNPDKLFMYFDMIDKDELKSNTCLGWIRSIFRPSKND